MKNKNIIIAIVSLILVIIIVVAVFLIINRKKETVCEVKELKLRDNVVEYKVVCNNEKDFVSVSYISDDGELSDDINSMEGEINLPSKPNNKVTLYYYYYPVCDKDNENCDITFGSKTINVR